MNADAPKKPLGELLEEAVAGIDEKANPMAEALASKAGVNVVNGGRKKVLADRLQHAYARWLREARKSNPRAKLGRYTPPQSKLGN